MKRRQAQFLVFSANGERCALRLEDIAEVMETFTPYPIPKAPPCLIGVINFHGSPVPVLDLASFLHGTPPRASGAILVLHRAIASLALRIDTVEHILTADAPNSPDTEPNGFMEPPISSDGGNPAFPLLSLRVVVERLEAMLRGRPGVSAYGAIPHSSDVKGTTKS